MDAPGLTLYLRRYGDTPPPIHWLWIVLRSPRFFHLRPSGRFDYAVDGSGRAGVAGCPFAMRPGDVARMRELLARGHGALQAHDRH